MGKAEKCFEKLHGTVGSMSALGRVFSEQEITEAWLRCTGEFEQAAAAKGTARRGAAAAVQAAPSRRPRPPPRRQRKRRLQRCPNTI